MIAKMIIVRRLAPWIGATGFSLLIVVYLSQSYVPVGMLRAMIITLHGLFLVSLVGSFCLLRVKDMSGAERVGNVFNLLWILFFVFSILAQGILFSTGT
jgi:hypothetical protein